MNKWTRRNQVREETERDGNVTPRLVQFPSLTVLQDQQPQGLSQHAQRQTSTTSRVLTQFLDRRPRSTMSLRKHPLYWFDDGSLILHIHDVLFRLHYSLLKRHSPYLASVDNVHPIEAIPIVSEIDRPSTYVLVGEDRRVSTRDAEALLEHMYHDL